MLRSTTNSPISFPLVDAEPGMREAALAAEASAATVQQMADTLTHSSSNLSSSTDDPAPQADLNGISSEDSLGKWSSDDRISAQAAAPKTPSPKDDAPFICEDGSDPPVRQPEVIPITGWGHTGSHLSQLRDPICEVIFFGSFAYSGLVCEYNPSENPKVNLGHVRSFIECDLPPQTHLCPSLPPQPDTPAAKKLEKT